MLRIDAAGQKDRLPPAQAPVVAAVETKGWNRADRFSKQRYRYILSNAFPASGGADR